MVDGTTSIGSRYREIIATGWRFGVCAFSFWSRARTGILRAGYASKCRRT
jgi:hypothetical protein